MRACMYVGRCVHDDCAWRGEFTGLEPVRATSKESRSLHVQYLHTYLHVLDICVTTLIKKKPPCNWGGRKQEWPRSSQVRLRQEASMAVSKPKPCAVPQDFMPTTRLSNY